MARTPEQIFYASRGYTPAEISEIEQRAKARAAERRELDNLGTLPRGTRLHINEHSTLNHAQQGTGKGR